MKLHHTNIKDVTAAVYVNHPWSPADCVLVLGTAENNQACFAVDQIPALVAVIERCADWIANNDPLPAHRPAYGHQKHQG